MAEPVQAAENDSQPESLSKPKKRPFNVAEFWAHENGIPTAQRRSRYACDTYVLLEDIPTWADDSAVLRPIKRADVVQNLKEEFAKYDELIDKHALRQAEKEALLRELDMSDSESESSSDSTASISDNELTEKKRRLRRLMFEKDPDPADLQKFKQDPLDFEPSEKINQKVTLWQGDITRLEIDAIVNAANASLLGGGGIDGAIHRAAGPSLYDECVELHGAETGETKITRGHRLPAQYILHTVGPQVHSPSQVLPRTKLEKYFPRPPFALTSAAHKIDPHSCYKSCLDHAIKHNIRSLAFCSISTGIYSFPIIAATHIAMSVVRSWLQQPKNAESVDRVIFCVFSDSDRDVYERMMNVYFPPVDETDLVALPCLDSGKWVQISGFLRQSITKMDNFLDVLQKVAGVTGHGALDLSRLTEYFTTQFSPKARSTFFKKSLPKIIELALKLPELFQKQPKKHKKSKRKADEPNQSPTPDHIDIDYSQLRLLVQGLDQEIRLTQEQTASLLACAFFGIIPNQVYHGQKFASPSFLSLFACQDAHNKEEEEEAIAAEQQNCNTKLKALLHYFDKVVSSIPNEHELIVRRKVFDEPFPDWRSGEERIASPRAVDAPILDSNPDELRLLASTKLVGSTVLQTSSVVSASEISWFQAPELFVVRIFASQLLANEVILVKGAEKFCRIGIDKDGKSTFMADVDDKTPTDEGIRRSTTMILDPAPDQDPKLQLRADNVFHDMNKLYFALYEAPSSPAGPMPNESIKKSPHKHAPTSELPPKRAPFVLALDDWASDTQFQADPYIKAIIALIVVSKFNHVGAAMSEKEIAKLPSNHPEPSIALYQSQATDAILSLVSCMHREQVSLKYLARMVLGKIQREPSQENLCARLEAEFSDWRKELKRMREEKEKYRRMQEKRRQREMEERVRMQKKMQKEIAKMKEVPKNSQNAGNKQSK